MTDDEALAKIMAVIREDLPEAETRLEIGKVLASFEYDISKESYDTGWSDAIVQSEMMG